MNSKTLSLLLVLIYGLCFQSCEQISERFEGKAGERADDCENEIKHTIATPIYRNINEIRKPIQMESPRDLTITGKVYPYQQYLLINELKQGIHFFDNSDPSNPINIGFLPIPGNVEIAFQNNMMIADNYSDLLTIDLSNIASPTLVNRVENANTWYIETEEGIIVDFIYEQEIEMVDCDELQEITCSIQMPYEFVQQNPDGTGGSLARLSFYDHFLYLRSNNILHIYDITDPVNPTKVGLIEIYYTIENMQTVGDKLVLGTQNGIFTFDLSNPALPQQISFTNLWDSCDPFTIHDNIVYVVNNSGPPCGTGTIDQLAIMDIQDPLNPVTLNTFQMNDLQSLAIKDNLLFVCDGNSGLKVFDIENPLTLDQHLLGNLTNFSAVDAIVLPQFENVLLVNAQEGIYQIDFSNPENLQILSVL
jgi:hypothetical protein